MENFILILLILIIVFITVFAIYEIFHCSISNNADWAELIKHYERPEPVWRCSMPIEEKKLWQEQQQGDYLKIKGWVARDENTLLCLYNEKPTKDEEYQVWLADKYLYIEDDLFPEVKWEDEEPTEVELIIKKI